MSKQGLLCQPVNFATVSPGLESEGEPVSFRNKFRLEMFYLNSTLNFGLPPVFVFQIEVYYIRLLPALTAQQKETTTRWY